ncbi:hypothetical protein RhiirA5_439400 [Rhizophagus irregularis]|uniref:Uncharacterized protein n=1 Tax=Rhizophagus irregularis TaxID=588596 RepID=A0A2N0NHW4_9GLOM|nr:hypothetical protein RhiirA5_439400 [Rhizophagus irregularis]
MDKKMITINNINFDMPIFTAFNSPITSIHDAPDLHCLLINLVPDSHNIKWKEHKKTIGITKKSFLKRPKQRKKRRRTNDENPTITDRSNYNIANIGYTNPFMTSIRNLDDSIFWIYLTSSNFRHNLPWINSLSINFIDSITFDHNLFYYTI